METKLKEILNWLEQYKEATRCRGIVLGISGGKDSTVVAMLAKKVWGNNVFGVLMPNGTQKDIDDALDIVKTLGIEHRIVNIETVYNSLLHVIENRIEETPIGRDFVANCPKVTDKASLYRLDNQVGRQRLRLQPYRSLNLHRGYGSRRPACR